MNLYLNIVITILNFYITVNFINEHYQNQFVPCSLHCNAVDETSNATATDSTSSDEKISARQVAKKNMSKQLNFFNTIFTSLFSLPKFQASYITITTALTVLALFASYVTAQTTANTSENTKNANATSKASTTAGPSKSYKIDDIVLCEEYSANGEKSFWCQNKPQMFQSYFDCWRKNLENYWGSNSYASRSAALGNDSIKFDISGNNCKQVFFENTDKESTFDCRNNQYNLKTKMCEGSSQNNVPFEDTIYTKKNGTNENYCICDYVNEVPMQYVDIVNSALLGYCRTDALINANTTESLKGKLNESLLNTNTYHILHYSRNVFDDIKNDEASYASSNSTKCQIPAEYFIEKGKDVNVLDQVITYAGKPPIIIGAAIGVVCILILSCVMMCACCCKKSQKEPVDATSMAPTEVYQ